MRTPKSWQTASESLEQNWKPLSESMVRGHHHRGNYGFDQNVDRTLSGELGGSDGEHIGPTTETVCDEQDVGVALRRYRKRADVVDTDGDARTFRDRHGDDWPTDSQSRFFSRLALQAVAKPPPGAHMPIHQQNRSSMRTVRVVLRWQEAVEWQACMIQGRMSRGT